MSREIEIVVQKAELELGAGYRLRRNIGNQCLTHLNPFLLLDDLKLQKPAGFYDHPHGGFESITYILEGSLRHEDSMGNFSIAKPGDLMWMTTGRGLVHCEVPKGKTRVRGINIWLILARKHKNVEPAYRKIADKNIPKKTKNGVTVRVLAGSSLGIESPLCTLKPILFLDIVMETGAILDQPVPAGWAGAVYLLSGRAMFGPKGRASCGFANETLILGPGDYLHMENKGPEVCRCLLLAGKPLFETIVHNNMFVTNTIEGLQDTITDYKAYRNGFEHAKGWRSSVVDDAGKDRIEWKGRTERTDRKIRTDRADKRGRRDGKSKTGKACFEWC